MSIWGTNLLKKLLKKQKMIWKKGYTHLVEHGENAEEGTNFLLDTL